MGGETDGALTLARQSIVSFGGNVSERILQFVFVIMVTHLLTPSTYGIFTLGVSIITFLRRILGLRLHRTLDYFIPKYLADDRYGEAKSTLLTAALLGTVSSTFGAILLYLLSGKISEVFNEPKLQGVLVVFTVVLIVGTVNDFLFGIFNSIKKLEYRTLTKGLVRPSVQLVVTVGLVLTGAGLFGLVWGYLIAFAITALVGIGILLRKVDWLRSADSQQVAIRELMAYSLPLALAGVVYSTIGQIDFFFIGYFLNADSVGYYRVAFLFASNVMLVTTSIKPIFKPMVSEARSDTSLLQQRYRLATRWILLITLPLSIPMLVAPRVYITLLFSAKYGPGHVALAVIVFGYLANASFGLEGMLLEGLGLTRLTLVNTLLTLLTNALVDLWLVPRLGIVGAAIGTGTALTVGGLAGLSELLYLRGLHPYSGDLGKIAVAGIVAFVITFLLVTIVDSSRVVTAVVVPLIVIAVYSPLILVANPFTADDVEIANRVDERLGTKLLARVLPER